MSSKHCTQCGSSNTVQISAACPDSHTVSCSCWFTYPWPFPSLFFLLSILSSEMSIKAEWVLCYILGLDDLFGPHLSIIQLRNCKSCYECWVAWCFTVVHLISDRGQILSIATTANSHHQSCRAQYLKPQEKLGGICWNGWFLKHQKDNLDHFTILSGSFKREMEEYARRIWELS